MSWSGITSSSSGHVQSAQTTYVRSTGRRVGEADRLGESWFGLRTEATMMRLERSSSRLYGLMLMLAAVVLLADQLTKLWAVSALYDSERVAVIPL